MQAPASDRTSQNRRRTPHYRILKAHLHEVTATRLMFNQLYGYHDNAMTQYIEDNQSSRMRTTFDERLPQRYDNLTQQEQELLYPEPTATHLRTIQPPYWVIARANYQCAGYALDTETSERIPCGRVRRAISHWNHAQNQTTNKPNRKQRYTWQCIDCHKTGGATRTAE